MERLIDKIREKFPTPKKASKGNPLKNDYCVGGAYLHFIGVFSFGKNTGFCEYLKLAEHLNGDPLEALNIIKANDQENFELAWELLSQAIERKNNRRNTNEEIVGRY